MFKQNPQMDKKQMKIHSNDRTSLSRLLTKLTERSYVQIVNRLS